MENKRLNKRTKSADISPLLYGKMQPQAPDLEGAIIGTILLEPDKFIIIDNIIKSPEVFYSDANQRIYASIKRLINDGKLIDFRIVCEDLRKQSELEMVGGSYYVTGLTRDLVSGANIEEHTRIVMQKYMLRELIRRCGETIGDAYEDTSDAFEVLEKISNELTDLSAFISGGQHKTLSTFISNYLDELHSKDERDELVKLYFREIDEYLGALKGGCMYVIAARPGHMKTSFLISSALMQSKNITVAVWNGELTTSRIINRFLCNKMGLESKYFDIHKYPERANDITIGTQDFLTDHKLLLDCTSSIDVNILVSKIRYWVFVCGARVVWLDYLNLIGVSEELEKYKNREQQMYYILQKLSAVCKECNIPLIILGQLNRDVMKLTDKIPNLSHLKEAGRIEEMVYHVGFLNRLEEYGITEDDNGSTLRRLDYLIRKNSDGKSHVDCHLRTKPEFFKVYEEEEVEIIYTSPSDPNMPLGTVEELPF